MDALFTCEIGSYPQGAPISQAKNASNQPAGTYQPLKSSGGKITVKLELISFIILILRIIS